MPLLRFDMVLGPSPVAAAAAAAAAARTPRRRCHIEGGRAAAGLGGGRRRGPRAGLGSGPAPGRPRGSAGAAAAAAAAAPGDKALCWAPRSRFPASSPAGEAGSRGRARRGGARPGAPCGGLEGPPLRPGLARS